MAKVKVLRFVWRRSEKGKESEEDKKNTGNGGYELNKRAEAVVGKVSPPWQGHCNDSGDAGFHSLPSKK